MSKPTAGHTWSSVQDFLDNVVSAGDGHHRILVEGGHALDLRLFNWHTAVSSGAVCVVFNGAVSNREEKVGPFFSGAGISRMTQLPLLAIADSAVTDYLEVGLGWYIGDRHFNMQPVIDDLLAGVSKVTDQDLLLIGGSGGGFAAMRAARNVGARATTVIWNPQTDVLQYSPRLVKQYLRRAFPELESRLEHPDWRDHVRAEFRDRGIEWEVLADADSRPVGGKLLILQNWNDWHTAAHAFPWLHATGSAKETWPGVYSVDDDHVLWVTEMGEGHAGPSQAALVVMIDQLLHGDTELLRMIAWNFTSQLFPHQHIDQYPRELVSYREMFLRGFSFDMKSPGRITPFSRDLPKGHKGVLVEYMLFKGDGSTEVKKARLGSTWVAPDITVKWDLLKIAVQDSMGNVLSRRDVFPSDLYPRSDNVDFGKRERV